MIPFITESVFFSFIDSRNREKTQERIKYYYDLYFSIKKRKDLRRCAKTRLLKNAEKEWRFWKCVEKWEQDFWAKPESLLK